jgi:hypothetical protein
VEQDVFKGDAIAAAQRNAAARVHQGLQRVLAVDGHDRAALDVCRRVQRDCQVRHHRLAGESLDGRNQSHGRQGNAPGTHRESLLVAQDATRRQHLIVVVQRLAHPHQDDVEPHLVQTERGRQQPHLGDDLSRRQIAGEAHFARQTEGAVHGAADLTRDAEGHRRRIGDEH